MTDIKPESVVLTVDQAAVLLGIGRCTAFKAVHDKQIPSIKVGRRLLVPKNAFDDLLHGLWPPSSK